MRGIQTSNPVSAMMLNYQSERKQGDEGVGEVKGCKEPIFSPPSYSSFLSAILKQREKGILCQRDIQSTL
jgi:hypothetical protein